MLTCGIKLTHDGAIALFKDRQLLFCNEIEKLKNNKRYSQILDTKLIEDVLNTNGYQLSEIDHFVIDGWGGENQEQFAIQPRLTVQETFNEIDLENNGHIQKVRVARYEEKTLTTPVLTEFSFEGLTLGNQEFLYSSFYHVAGHICSAYGTSEFAKNQEDAYILVWDGGMYPKLYYFDVRQQAFENLGPIFFLVGNIYTIFAQHFGPYKVESGFAKDNLSIAGKVMAYIAKGEVKEELYEVFDDIYQTEYDYPMGFANKFSIAVKQRLADRGYSEEDILCTFHHYLEKLLIEKLIKKVARHSKGVKNLCIAGGCGLNIKWNSAIRDAKIFSKVYVPPFPNDSGSAIGMAIAKIYTETGKMSGLDWNVYSGPALVKRFPSTNTWDKKVCSLQELAKLLYETNEPVIFLNGRAELGPRALGNRSIIAAPHSETMKDLLNDIKQRESFRPVSPMTIEEYADDYFTPAITDQYMLFDHFVKPEVMKTIGAVTHLDGTARLQTVSKSNNEIVYELLQEYKKLSGLPMLCNTSANYNGSGFFPDVYSAAEWGKTNYIWSEGFLFQKIKKED